MIDYSLLLIFIPTMFFISITPGMCMTLAMTLGMTIGLRRTFLMMWGEVIGVALVASLSVIGVASIIAKYPTYFDVFKYLGGAYLAWLGIQMWMSRGKMSLNNENIEIQQGLSGWQLASQGFITAVANPKGWAFFVALLPPFINQEIAIGLHNISLMFIIILSEFICMTIYATGGKTLRHFLSKSGNVRLINRIAGTLMIGVGIWLASS